MCSAGDVKATERLDHRLVSDFDRADASAFGPAMTPGRELGECIAIALRDCLD